MKTLDPLVCSLFCVLTYFFLVVWRQPLLLIKARKRGFCCLKSVSPEIAAFCKMLAGRVLLLAHSFQHICTEFTTTNFSSSSFSPCYCLSSLALHRNSVCSGPDSQCFAEPHMYACLLFPKPVSSKAIKAHCRYMILFVSHQLSTTTAKLSWPRATAEHGLCAFSSRYIKAKKGNGKPKEKAGTVESAAWHQNILDEAICGTLFISSSY